MHVRLAVLVTLAAAATRAHADGAASGALDTASTPRAIGRAGVGTVGDDGGAALLVNPAAMARRDALRAQLGLAYVDDGTTWVGAASSPVATDQAGSRAIPMVALEGGLGDWVLGASVTTAAVTDRSFRRPGRIPPEELGDAFAYRYAGLLGSLRRDTLAVGASRRLGESVAVGLAFAASRVAITETRRVWASALAGRAPGDPNQDVELALAADDAFVPGGSAGILVAPVDTRLELGLAVTGQAPGRATGDVGASGPATGIAAPGVLVTTTSPRSTLALAPSLAVRAGVRWLADRWLAELDADAWLVPASAADARWGITGVDVVDATTRTSIAVDDVPTRASARSRGAVRGALEVELLPGFLWATGGYAFSMAGTATARLSPTFGALGGHTAALGLELTAGAFTVTLGWSRTWAMRTPVAASAWHLDNPFDRGGATDPAVPGGTYDAATDRVGISIDAELDPP